MVHSLIPAINQPQLCSCSLLTSWNVHIKAKAETEAYLQQLEQEGRVEEVYGKGVQLIVPSPAFVAKTRTRAEAQKVFINICTSPKVKQMRLQDQSIV